MFWKKTMNVMQFLLDAGINAFGAELLAESLLKHPNPIPIKFTLPINRSDCPNWIGVRFVLEPIPKPADPDPIAAQS
jgi:hypothetical protein